MDRHDLGVAVVGATARADMGRIQMSLMLSPALLLLALL